METGFVRTPDAKFRTAVFNFVPRTQSYDRELQRKRSKNLQCVLKTKRFSSALKNALAYYSAGVVAVNLKVGLAPDKNIVKTISFPDVKVHLGVNPTIVP
jgi:hypothetical protein